MSSSEVPPRVSIMGTFPIGSRSGADFCVRAPQVCVFCQEKHRERENNNRKRNVCTERGMGGERETTRRERTVGEEGLMPLSSGIREGGGGNRQREKKWSKETCDLGGCSLSPRIVRRCRCFSLFLYLVVPFPNFTLQIPLLTLTKVDAVVIHLANLLQFHYKEYGESLRNLWFLDMFAFLTA